MKGNILDHINRVMVVAVDMRKDKATSEASVHDNPPVVAMDTAVDIARFFGYP